jgi:predicted transposase YdaD
MGDHDTVFKRAFSVPAHAAGEVRSVLPASAVAHFDLSALELVPASFIDAEMAHRHADLLFRAPFDGQPAYVYFLLEHQSTVDALMPFRVLEGLERKC